MWRRYSYGWIILILAATSLTAHFVLSMHNGDDLAQWAQSVAENLQSEFIQLLAQVCGLAYFLYVGSPSSKEGSERLEAKIDALLAHELPDGAQVIRTLDTKHMRR
jgi:hypothetical protein